MSGTRDYYTPPKLNEGVRARMLDSIYSASYANTLPREQFDSLVGGKSDLEIANVAFKTTAPKGQSRSEFNKMVGLSSAGGSTQQAITSGMSLGLTDEVSGAVSGLGSLLRGEGFSKGYGDTTRAMRENAEVFRQNNPWLGRGLEVAGGLAGGGAASGVRLGANAAPLSLPQMMKQSAAIGAVSGAGDATGTTDRLVGAGLGAAIGGALPPVLQLVGAGAGRLVDVGSKALGLNDPNTTATRSILRTLGRADKSPDDVRQSLAAIPSDKPVGLADLMEQPGRNLGAVLANRPGAGGKLADDFVQARQTASPDRLAEDFNRYIAPGSGNTVLRTTEGLQQARTTAAEPLYREAFNKPFGMTDPVRNFLDSPEARRGLARGLEIQRIENEARKLRGETALPTTDPAIKFLEDGTPKIVGQPNMRSLDAVKRGLDAIIEDARDPITKKVKWTEYLRAIDEARRAYVQKLDVGSEPYAAARAAWQGPSEAMDAMRFGRAIPRLDRDVVSRQVPTTSPANMDFMRLGLSRSLSDTGAQPRNVPSLVDMLTQNRNMADKLNTVLPPENAAALRNAMNAEKLMIEGNRAFSPRANSQTFRHAAADAETDANQGLIGKFLRRTSLGERPIWGVARDIYDRARLGSPESTDATSRMMFNPDREAIAGILQLLESRAVMDAMKEYAASQALRAGAGAASGAINQQVR